MRCFLAVDVPEDIKDRMSKLQQELAGLDTRLVDKESMHFTLKFLGEVDEGKMKAVAKAASGIKTPRFTVRIRGIGFFPAAGFIRVVWAGTESEQFLSLHIAVNEALSSVFPKEKPVPHLTLARVRTQKYREELLEFARRHENEDFGAFAPDKITLKKSTLTSKGPVYEDVEVFELHDN